MEPPPWKKNCCISIASFPVADSIIQLQCGLLQTYAADIFFSQTWQDYRLRFPDNLTADYRLLPTSWLNSMWRPDSFFKNAKKVTFQDVTIPNHYIWLYKDKSILYMVKYVSCPVPSVFSYFSNCFLKLSVPSICHPSPSTGGRPAKDSISRFPNTLLLILGDDNSIPSPHGLHLLLLLHRRFIYV